MLVRLLSLALAASMAIAPAAPAKLHTGQYLRLHVVAQDDSPQMQAVKAPVRTAVQAEYAAHALRSGSMLLDAALLMPSLTKAAQQAAAQVGFGGAVTVSLEAVRFDTRTLDGCTIPAGVYPALMVRLGTAQGHNWWGLLDPELSLDAAAIARDGDTLRWDWSLTGLLEALAHWFGGVSDAS